MELHLTDEQVALLVTELDRIIEGDRYRCPPASGRCAAAHRAARFSGDSRLGYVRRRAGGVQTGRGTRFV
jgi:hypothetical protein